MKRGHTAIEYKSQIRRLRKISESLDERQRQAYATITKLTNQAISGESYPDATFTLRLSFGKAIGYELGTTKVPMKTTFWGLYGRNAASGTGSGLNRRHEWRDMMA